MGIHEPILIQGMTEWAPSSSRLPINICRRDEETRNLPFGNHQSNEHFKPEHEWLQKPLGECLMKNSILI